MATGAPGTSVLMKIGVWYDEDERCIKLNIPGHGLTSVNDRAESMRGNPSLFKRLARALRDPGAKHPPGI